MTEEPQPLPLDTPPVVGQVYLVPCLDAGDGRFLPIIGPRHADPGHGINAREIHYHTDVRFRRDEALAGHLGRMALAQGGWAEAIIIAMASPEEVAAMAAMNLIHLDNNHRPVTLRPVRCEREAPIRPPPSWQRELEAAYAGKTLSPDGRCPPPGSAGAGPAAARWAARVPSPWAVLRRGRAPVPGAERAAPQAEPGRGPRGGCSHAGRPARPWEDGRAPMRDDAREDAQPVPTDGAGCEMLLAHVPSAGYEEARRELLTLGLPASVIVSGTKRWLGIRDVTFYATLPPETLVFVFPPGVTTNLRPTHTTAAFFARLVGLPQLTLEAAPHGSWCLVPLPLFAEHVFSEVDQALAEDFRDAIRRQPRAAADELILLVKTGVAVHLAAQPAGSAS